MSSKGKKVKAPKTKGVAKVPVIMQLEALECGAACLAMILAYYGKWIPLSKLRVDCGISRDGANLKNVLNAARSYGFEAHGARYEPETLKQKGCFPCVIHWNFTHFVVLNGFKGNKAVITDPAYGTATVSKEEFDTSYTGICIMIRPLDSFEPGGKPKSILEFARRRLKGSKSAFIVVALASLAAAIIGIINPAFSRVLVDDLLGGNNPEWIAPFIMLMAIVGIAQVAIASVSIIGNRRIEGKFAVIANSSYLWHVLHLPMEFFSQRMAGDLGARQSSNEGIASSLINQLAPALFNFLMLLLYVLVMASYSLALTLVGLTSVLLNAYVANRISARRVDISRVQMRDSGMLSAATVAGIQMMETIKASGAESGFFAKWAGYQASVNVQNVRFAKLNQYLGALPEAVSSLTNVAILMLGVYLTMTGSFTVGLLLAFQGLMASFNAPVQSLITSSQSVQEMRACMERVDDVMEYPVDTLVVQDTALAERDLTRLTGRIEVRDVTFGYSRLADPYIKNLSFSLMPGKSIAIVGHSGCGKSTVVNLVTGLAKPWNGQILFDGKPLAQIDNTVLTSSLAVVDQDAILFEGSIRDNLKLWDETLDDKDMVSAARDAQIHMDIMKREGGYGYKILEGGKDFSGGQRQRLEIARVLTQDPSIVILDEATSALDAHTEYEVIEAVKQRGITCIVIAHRLSTIRDCDEIIVLDHGQVVERGTHEDLLAAQGYYTKLVMSN